MDKWYWDEKYMCQLGKYGNAVHENRNEDIEYYKADEVDVDKTKDTARIRELEEEKYQNWKLYVKKRDEVARLRKMLKGRCTDEEWETLKEGEGE